MSNLFKKVTSAVAGLAIVFSVVSPIAGVSAAYTSLEAANKLATLGVIVDQSSNPADYRLGDTLTRREHTKVAMNLASCQAVEVADTCNGSFSDMDSSDWGCKYAETALANGFVAANATFNPGRDVSKAEALKMIMNATGVAKSSNTVWEAAYVEGAVSAGIISDSFSDYTAAASRGWIFQAAAEAVELCNGEEDDEDDLLGSLLDGLTDDEDDTTNEEDDTPVVSGDDQLMVSLSPSTPASVTIPGGVNGLPVAAFDFTAGSSDVTISQLTLKRRGLSDKDTILGVAAFTDEGRASNEKNDNQENDTEAQLNLSDGGIVVKAGETRTVSIVADLNTAANAANDEFSFEIVGVQASSSVDGYMGVVSNTMKIGSVDAPTITFDTSGSVSDPQLGETGADIFEFEIEGDNNEDVVLKSLTFEGSSDAEDDLMNFELYMGNDLVASTQYMKDDYLTFDLGDGLIIEEDKNEDFTVKADVVEGASDTIGFSIDEELDVTAESTKFGYGAAVDITTNSVNVSNAFGTITIEAGELTIVEVDADFDEIREDKDNVVLGKIKVTNVAGQNLELQEIGVRVQITAGTTGFTQASQFLEDVELYSEDTGSSYELTINGTDDLDVVYSDNNIDVLLPQGTTTWSFRVDTAENITNFDTASFELSLSTGTVSATTGGFYVEETEDDTAVSDITPSSLSFNTIDGAESGAEVALVPLSDTDVVRGADDVVALQFTVEAEESSSIVLEEIRVNVQRNVDAVAAAATNQEIADVKLYKGSVSESNLLDSESGSNIGTGGDVTFDDMGDVNIAANGIETFVVTISIVDGTDAVTNSDYRVSVQAIDIEDDDNDDVTATGLPATSSRDITVNNAGTIQTLTLDSANEDNEFDKLALAGGSVVIGSWDVRADNEEVDVETVNFTIAGFAGSNNLRDTVTSATLLLDGVAVATNTNSDIALSNTGITFDDLTGLIIPETTTELALQLNTANIGEDFTGEILTGLTVTQIQLDDAEGVESGKDLASPAATATATSKTLDIVSAIVTPSVVSTLGTDDQTAELRLVVDGGDNTTGTGDAVQAEVTTLTFDVSSLSGTGTITVFNGNGDNITTGGSVNVTTAGALAVALTSDSIGNDDETYRIENTAEAVVRLAKNGVTYTVNGATPTTTKLENTLELGQYADSN